MNTVRPYSFSGSFVSGLSAAAISWIPLWPHVLLEIHDFMLCTANVAYSYPLWTTLCLQVLYGTMFFDEIFFHLLVLCWHYVLIPHMNISMYPCQIWTLLCHNALWWHQYVFVSLGALVCPYVMCQRNYVLMSCVNTIVPTNEVQRLMKFRRFMNSKDLGSRQEICLV